MHIIILTACDSLDVIRQTMDHGARDYLVKPIDPELILRRANEVMQDVKRAKLKVNPHHKDNPGELYGKEFVEEW